MYLYQSIFSCFFFVFLMVFFGIVLFFFQCDRVCFTKKIKKKTDEKYRKLPVLIYSCMRVYVYNCMGLLFYKSKGLLSVSDFTCSVDYF